MKKILVATHEKFAEGIVSTANLILGKQENLSFINAYTDEIPFNEKLEAFISTVDEKDTLIVFTDIFGGSVNQTALGYLNRKNVYLISGINLPLLLEVVMLSEEQVNEAKLKEVVHASREQIIFANNEINKNNESSDDDFDL